MKVTVMEGDLPIDTNDCGKYTKSVFCIESN